MERTQSRNRNINLTDDNTSWIIYPDGQVKRLTTIWKAKLPHNDVVDMPEYAPETCYGRDTKDSFPEGSPVEASW